MDALVIVCFRNTNVFFFSDFGMDALVTVGRRAKVHLNPGQNTRRGPTTWGWGLGPKQEITESSLLGLQVALCSLHLAQRDKAAAEAQHVNKVVGVSGLGCTITITNPITNTITITFTITTTTSTTITCTPAKGGAQCLPTPSASCGGSASEEHRFWV